MPKRRVTFLINSLAGGGAERVMATLLAQSRDECSEFDVSLVLLDDMPDDYEAPSWVSVHRLDCRGSVWRSVAGVTKLMQRLRPDVTLSFLTRANVANVLAMRGPRVISARIHTSVHLEEKPNTALRVAVRMTYPRASKVIAVADDLADDLCRNFGVDAARVVSIPNPIDVANIKRLAREAESLRIEAPYIVAAGRLVGIKNFDLLIRAVAMSGLPHKLVILGEGPDRDLLLATAQQVGLSDRVIFPGRLANPFPLMAGADLFALSSNGEGFPNVLVEAMALGVPVVATDCPSGPSEIIACAPRGAIQKATLSPYGVLTPPNDVGEFSTALSLAAQSDIRVRLASAGPVRAARYNPIDIKDRYWSVLRAEMGPATSDRART
jgi:N-acetylgalactosamine-N,N'-diacetylbacillosaminyl-diphospho-undecaprenol 4-alpha-N-acetylgalactosaminyltransferase